MASFLLIQKALSASTPKSHSEVPLKSFSTKSDKEYKEALKKEISARRAGFKAAAGAYERGASPEKVGADFYRGYNAVMYPKQKGAIEGFCFKDKEGGLLTASDIGKSLISAILDGGIGYLFKLGLSAIEASDTLDLTPPRETKEQKQTRKETISKNKQAIKSADKTMIKAKEVSAKKEAKSSFVKKPKIYQNKREERKNS